MSNTNESARPNSIRALDRLLYVLLDRQHLSPSRTLNDVIKLVADAIAGLAPTRKGLQSDRPTPSKKKKSKTTYSGGRMPSMPTEDLKGRGQTNSPQSMGNVTLSRRPVSRSITISPLPLMRRRLP